MHHILCPPCLHAESHPRQEHPTGHPQMHEPREQPLSSAWTRQRKAKLVAAKDQRQGLDKRWWVIPPRHLNMACGSKNCGENRVLALAGSLRLSRGFGKSRRE